MITSFEYSWLSIVPPLLAILLALKTKQVYPSLIIGIFSGYLIIEDWNIFEGLFQTVNATVKIFDNSGNTQIIIFTCLIGGLLKLIQVSGGNKGILSYIDSKLKSELSESIKIKKIQFYAYLTGLLLFIETNISILSVGSTFRPIFDRFKIPRVKLAYIADSSSSPISVMVPFNAWGAFIMGLLATNNIDSPFKEMFKALPFNFYAITSILLVLFLIFKGKDYFTMNRFIKNKSYQDITNENLSANIEKVDENLVGRVSNLILPISVLIFTMPAFLVLSGLRSSDFVESKYFLDNLFNTFKYSSGSWSVLMAVISAIIVLSVKLLFEKKLNIINITENLIEGMKELLPLAIIMVLAFGIGNLCKELKTGIYLANMSKDLLSKEFLPLIIFITTGIIAFSTGTSWGTFAIMMSIAIPMATTLDANTSLVLAAVLSGGVFGDHCSPISDTTIISSLASGTNHIDHVRTQLPYALIAGLISSSLFLIFGILTSY